MPVLLAATLLLVAPPPDGFYRTAPAPDAARTVAAPDGRTFGLGERREFEIQRASLISQNNENECFSLSLKIPREPLDGNDYFLLLDGTAYPQAGWGSDAETSSLHFYFTEQAAAKRAAAPLKTPLLLREHPGHRMLVTFTPTKEEFDVGEPVSVTLRIKNVGDAPFTFQKGGMNRAARDNQYQFNAYRNAEQVPDIGTTRNFGGISVLKTLEPGETFEDAIELNKWFAFDELGHYEIQGSYFLSFHDPEEESYRTLWEDYATDEFIIRVAEPSLEHPVDP